MLDKPHLVGLEHVAKIVTVLSLLCLILSVIYETAYFVAAEVNLLAAYDVKDVIRSSLLWIPQFILIMIVCTAIEGLIVFAGSLRRERMHQIDVLGPPPSRGLKGVRDDLAALAREPIVYISLLMFAIAVAYTIPGRANLAWLAFFALAIVFLATASEAFFREYVTTLKSVYAGSTAVWIRVLVIGVALTCQLGTLRAWNDIDAPPDVWIEVKKAKDGDYDTFNCRIMKMLSESVIARCTERVFLFRNTEVRLVGTRTPVTEKK